MNLGKQYLFLSVRWIDTLDYFTCQLVITAHFYRLNYRPSKSPA